MSACNIRGCDSGLPATVVRHSTNACGMVVYGSVCATCAAVIDSIRAKSSGATVKVPRSADKEVKRDK